MEEIQNGWDPGCCIPGCIPAGRHLTPIFSLPTVLTKIIAAFPRSKKVLWLSAQRDSFLRHLHAGWHHGSVFQWHRTHLVQRGVVTSGLYTSCREQQTQSGLLTVLQRIQQLCFTELHMYPFPLACGLGHEGLLECAHVVVILKEYLNSRLWSVCQIVQRLAEGCLSETVSLWLECLREYAAGYIYCQGAVSSIRLPERIKTKAYLY